MTLTAEVKDRISSGVELLTGAVQEAADLAELVRQNAMPQKPVAAFVLPLGFDGGRGDAATGLFRQAFNETIAVLLIVQTQGDATAQKAIAKVDALIKAVCALLCGWAPEDATGVLSAMRGRLVSVAAGTVIYQIDFSLQNQLRITPT